MFQINDDLSINITRGDTAVFTVNAVEESGSNYLFQKGDVLRIKVTEKKACENVMFQKDFVVEKETEQVELTLTEEDTKIGEVISKPTDYWYEVELNPLNNPQTIIGYDENGAKIFKLFPEGKDIEPVEPTPEDIPVVDEELDLTSERPVQNSAIARAFLNIQEEIGNINIGSDLTVEDLKTLEDGIETNKSNIAKNKGDIEDLSSNVEELSSKVDAHTINIDELNGDVDDVNNQINTLKSVEEILERKEQTFYTIPTEVYRYTATRKCLVNLSAMAFYINSCPTLILIEDNKSEISANAVIDGEHSYFSGYASCVLEAGQSITVKVKYKGESKNTVLIRGTVQYL